MSITAGLLSPPPRVISPAACSSDQDRLCYGRSVSMTSVRGTANLESLDERCRPADIALGEGELQTYVALLNDGQIPAYAVIKVCSSVVLARQLTRWLHLNTIVRSHR